MQPTLLDHRSSDATAITCNAILRGDSDDVSKPVFKKRS